LLVGDFINGQLEGAGVLKKEIDFKVNTDGSITKTYQPVDLIYAVNGETIESKYYGNLLGIINCMAENGVNKHVEDPFISALITEAIGSYLVDNNMTISSVANKTISNYIQNELEDKGNEASDEISEEVIDCILSNIRM